MEHALSLRITPITLSIIYLSKQNIYKNKIYITTRGKKKKLLIRTCDGTITHPRKENATQAPQVTNPQRCGNKFWARETFNHMKLYCPDCYRAKTTHNPPSYCLPLSKEDKILIDVYHAISGVHVQ